MIEFLNKLELSFREHIPVIHQTESSECGLACLAMISGYYGKNVDLSTLRRRFNLSARGTTLTALKEIAEQTGFICRPVSLGLNELVELKLPCILHWDFNHFVLLTKVAHSKAVIHDPARGRYTIGLDELSNHFTGVAMEAWPGSDFKTEKTKTRLKLKKLFGSVHGMTPAIIKILSLSLIIESVNLLLPIGTQLVMDYVIPASDKGLLSLICTGLMFFILLRAVISSLRAWNILVMKTFISFQWKAGLFSHLMKLPLGYFERRKIGDIQSRFSSLDTLLATFTTSLVGAIIDIVMIIGVTTMLICYGGFLAWLVFGFTAIYVSIRLFTYGYYRQLSEDLIIKDARASSYFTETLFGIATAKMQGIAGRRANHWLNLITESINTRIKVSKMDLFFGGINTFISACDQMVILWLGTTLIIDNHMTVGMFVAFGLFRSQFTDRIGSLTNFTIQLRMLSLHNERISDIALSETENIQPEAQVKSLMKPMKLTASSVSFFYDDYSMAIFKDINLTVSAGESVVIIGPSGTGKTTLMKVLCGLFEPSDGSVYIDGVDIKKLGVNNYRQRIACVMQDDRLFSGSLKENICGFSDAIDEDWLVSCSKAAHIHDDIKNMPMEYETLVGELGEGLSGGQKQRIFIARALYRKPGILFMDEATSHLDSQSEQLVNDAVKSMKITRVIIAHRDTTIRSADRIIDLSKIHNAI